ncbi:MULTISPECIES: hypothetical protein [unclassified Archaeoglobus]|jgi:hypothetical protein|uniref:hypothetical protein n=1 Tax=unclassified Archaeoglobus TaxID=2643606 RepID=UPI0025C506D1|nr:MULTISPECIES: hypothetical protein [unclassified Archaeoglobus]
MGDMSFGIFRILAGSPFYKDFLRKTANEFFDPAVVENEVKEILDKDIEFTATIFSLMPRTANTLFGVMRGFNAYSSKFTSDALVGILKGVAGDFDAKYAAETLNEFFDGMERLRKDYPKLFAEITGQKIEEFFDTLDFGKLRKFIEDTAYCSQGIFEILNEKIIGNPIKLANLMASMPAVTNASIAIANDALQRTEMPSELLASATFNTLESLNVEDLAKLVENLAKFVNKLHEGNYILGRGEAKFKEVAENIIERFLNSIDVEELKKAVLALLDDARDVNEAFTNALWRNPLALMSLSSLVPIAVNVLVEMLGKILSKFEELPVELTAQIVTTIIKEIDADKLGDVITVAARTFNEVAKRNPEVISGVINAAIASADSKEIEKLINNLTKSFVDVLLSNPEVLTAAVTPLVQSFADIVKINKGGEE